MKNINSTTNKKHMFYFGNMGIQKKHIVMPVFLPFEGCPHRCLFCAQDKQTGLKISAQSPVSVKIEHALKELKRKRALGLEDVSVEIAFYGGTFTLLPPKILQQCLDFVKFCYDGGLIVRARCSTRPDALNTEVLKKLKYAGIQLIELGVQSFSDTALNLVRRGYTKMQILEACQSISLAGLEFGIQLLPGMPGSTPDVFLDDVNQALSLSPTCLRFYPCLVVDGTELAIMWRKGLYQPWDLSTTIKTLGNALAKAWSLNVPVIRLSLAPEDSLDSAILAGPRHPALGSMIQGEALLYTVEEVIQKYSIMPKSIGLPSFCKGFFYGHAGSLKDRWKRIGISISNIYWSDDVYGEVVFV